MEQLCLLETLTNQLISAESIETAYINTAVLQLEQNESWITQNSFGSNLEAKMSLQVFYTIFCLFLQFSKLFVCLFM